MDSKNAVKGIAKQVARDVKTGKVTKYTHNSRAFMEGNPVALLDVIDLIHPATNRKKPNEDLIHAYLSMFTWGLEGLRMERESGHDWPDQLLLDIDELLEILAGGGVISPELLMLLLNCFVEARVPVSEDLVDLMGDVAIGTAEAQGSTDDADVSGLLDDIVAEVGSNPFDVLHALNEVSQTLPPAFRAAILPMIGEAANPGVRDVLALYLLDPAPEVRAATCTLLTDLAAPAWISPVTLRRMIAVRNWLPQAERPALDAAIRRCRTAQVECAPWPEAEVESLLSTQIDGAGAQSISAVALSGRKRMLANLLLKEGVGIADSWCHHGITKAETKKFLGIVRNETTSIPAQTDFLDRLIPHFLFIGQSNGSVPVAGFLDFIEGTGIQHWQPAETSSTDLCAFLETEMGGAAAADNVVPGMIDRSDELIDSGQGLDTWFEQDAETDRVLSSVADPAWDAACGAVLAGVLEPRREKWAARFLWAALWLKQKRNQDILAPWTGLFIVGRELMHGRPMEDIPAMVMIAGRSVEAQRFEY